MFSSILFLPLVLGRELSVIVVTDWKEGQIKTSNPDSPSADISTLHQTVLVGDKDYTQVTKFGYLDLESLEIAPDSFTVWRESGTGNEKFKCQFQLVEDPGVELIHIMLLGDKKPYVNVFGDKWKLDC